MNETCSFVLIVSDIREVILNSWCDSRIFLIEVYVFIAHTKKLICVGAERDISTELICGHSV